MTEKKTEAVGVIEASKELATVLALIGAAILFAENGNDTLAATALGGCLTYVMPRGSKVPPVALGLIAGAAFTLAHHA